MEKSFRIREIAVLFLLPLIVLLCSCGESIEPPEEVVVKLPDNVLTTATTTETTVTTTTVTLSPEWQEHAVGNYYGAGGVLIEGVPHYSQLYSYFTACESFASISVLQYYGIDVNIDQFIDDLLPKADYPVMGTDGQQYGASPWEYFIGSPRDGGGFGCYNTAIADAINTIQDGLAIPLRDKSIESLCHDYIDKGQPVIFWGTIYMQQPYISEFEWYLPDGSLYQFINPEHALVLIGYDDNWYYFCDSMAQTEIAQYSKYAVENAYEGLFRQAVVIDPLVLETLPETWRPHLEEVEGDV